MPENNAIYLFKRQGCIQMYSIYWYKKQTKNLCTSESVCCLQHALIFEFFRHAGMRQMVTQYQEYYILSYTLTNWPSIAVI